MPTDTKPHTLTLDFAHDGDLNAALALYADFEPVIADPAGPSGWPLVTFTVPQASLADFAALYDADPADLLC